VGFPVLAENQVGVPPRRKLPVQAGRGVRLCKAPWDFTPWLHPLWGWAAGEIGPADGAGHAAQHRQQGPRPAGNHRCQKYASLRPGGASPSHAAKSGREKIQNPWGGAITMTQEEMLTALYEKMAAEQDKYRDWLKSQPAAEVL